MRSLCLTAWVLLCFAFTGHTLKCHYCVREDPTGCRDEVRVCFPKPGQKCIAFTVYDKNEVKYRMEGCTLSHKDCKKKWKGKAGYVVNLSCCTTNLCNHWDFEEM